MARAFRIGQIVPNSNTTMETEIPAMLREREAAWPERFTFHSSRMRMMHVVKEELAAMDAESLRCAAELADGRMNVIGYACLVAIMAMGPGYHVESEARLADIARDVGGPAPIVSSAGSLIAGLRDIEAQNVAILTPYMKPLTQLVVNYLENAGIKVSSVLSLEIPDNLEVGRRDPALALDAAARLDLAGAHALVLSACVQMSSATAIDRAEQRFGLPVVTAASCTTRRMLIALGLEPVIPGFGAALSARHA